MRGRALCTGIACAILACSRQGAPGDGFDALPQRGKTYAVTLVTGDRVFYSVAADGAQSATVAAAPREDGRPVAFQSAEWGGHLHVVPSDVAGEASLDPALFDVTQLVIERDDDESSPTLPLIVASSVSSALRTNSLRMATSREMSSVRATAVALSKGQLASHRELLSAVRTGAASPQKRIWLDRRIHAVLDHSAPQIGAPEAWQGGIDGTGVAVAVVDTGIDGTHPDLSGKVRASANFSTSPAGDHFGHGTHVASIIAGTGTASGGLRKGVAPGATLLEAKVLGDDGTGLESAVIAGLEWATTQQGARIVNLSLGGAASDGSDPLSQSVNDLARRTGALFVIAAGNSGPNAGTVGSPGAADEALTVGAVDALDALTVFSSRGPRLGDFAVKPEIVAPGNQIAAARAAGTTLGTVVDERYVRASGTSMATPHVAGAAALLLQKHPAWSGPQLKAALIESASHRDPAQTPFAQGAGRIDVPAALAQTIVATPATIGLGLLRWPQNGPALHRTVTFSNTSAMDVALTLTADGRGVKSGAPATMFTLSSTAVTVPANGTATIDVAVDPTQGVPDVYAGYLTARAAAGALTLPFSFRKEPESYDLTVETIARDGRPAHGSVWIVNVDDSTILADVRYLGAGGPISWRVPKGTYCIVGELFTMDAANVQFIDVIHAPLPEVSITGPTTLTLDARQATELLVDTPGRETKKNENALAGSAWYRVPLQGPLLGLQNLYTASGVWKREFILPTVPATKGAFEISARIFLEAPDIKMHVDPALDLHPEYEVGSLRYDGTARMELADAGTGTAAELAGRALNGKIALLTRSDSIRVLDQANNAAAAGAVLAIVHNDYPGARDSFPGRTRIPVVLLSQEEGLQLRALLARGAVAVDVRGIAQSPFRYDLVFPYSVVPASLRQTVTDANVATIAAAYHRPSAGSLLETRWWFRAGDRRSFTFTYDAPLQRTDYVLANDTLWQQAVFAQLTPPVIFTGAFQRYVPGQSGADAWLQQPLRPVVVETPQDGAPEGFPAVRIGDLLSLRLPNFADSQGHYAIEGAPGATALRLYRGGQQIADGPNGYRGIGVPSDPGTYRLELDVDATNATWTDLSRRSHTAWTFQSKQTAGPEALPFVLLDVDLPLDAQNRAMRRPDLAIGLRARHQISAAQTAIGEVQLSLSFDDGQTWRPASLAQLAAARWQATADLTAAPDPSFGSLRLHAADAEGNRLDQDVLRAFAVGGPAGFALAVDPPLARLSGRGTTTIRVSTRLMAGAAERIGLSATGLPPGVNAKFEPPAVSSGETSLLTLSASAAVGAGTWPVHVMGSAASGPGETILQLTTLALPAVAVTSPVPGALPAGATTIFASATVSAGTSLQRLDVEVDGATIASGAASPLAASWNAEPGAHVIIARALDSAGNAASSDEVRVTVGSSAQGGGGGTDGGTPPSTPAGSPMENLHSSGCNSTGVDFTGAPVLALALVLRRRRLRRCGS